MFYSKLWLITVPTKGHSSKTEEVINGGRGQTLASNLRRSDSIGQAASDDILCDAPQSRTSSRAEQRSIRNDVEQPRNDRTTRDDDFLHTPPNEPLSPPQLQITVQASGRTADYEEQIHMNTTLRDKVTASSLGLTDLPSLGKVNPHNNNIYVYARVVLTTPGELTTKTITNPHVIKAFKFNVPDIYEDSNLAWYWNPHYIQALVNSGQTVLETAFPFTIFQHLGIKYQIEPQSIFFNYQGDDELLFHRINLIHIKSLDPNLRFEHLKQSVPLPIQYRTPSGLVYHACFDIAYSCANINPKHTRDLPGNQNEAIFMDNINHLATSRTESLVTIAKLLQLYNDYRVNVFRKPQPFFSSTKESFVLPVPPRTDPVTNQPLNVPAFCGPQQIPMPATIPNPESEIQRERNAIFEHNQNTSIINNLIARYAPHHLQEVFKHHYPSPYEETPSTTTSGRTGRKQKRKNVQIDPTIPWQPTNPRLWLLPSKRHCLLSRKWIREDRRLKWTDLRKSIYVYICISHLEPYLYLRFIK